MIKTSELIKLLAERKGFKAKETEDFVGTFFDVIVEGLQTDGIVKIKGLGTFKVTSVKERESINVNTGERVIISGHNKLTFTPDTSMRDMVNKPFSQFETVVINDGVDFADMTEDGDMEDAVETANEETVTTQVTDKVTVKAEDAMKIAEETAEQASPEPVCETNNMMTEKNSSLSCDTRVSSAPSSEIVSPTPQCQDEVLEATHPTTATEPSPPQKKGIIKYIVATACGILLFILGYWVGKTFGTLSKESPKIVQTTKQMARKPQRQSQIASQDTVKSQRQTTEESVPAPKITNHDEFEAANQKVAYGAYKIIGVERIVVARKGQTLYSISKAHLGPGSEVYVQALNEGVKDIKEGQKIKIPKLISKKKLATRQ